VNAPLFPATFSLTPAKGFDIGRQTAILGVLCRTARTYESPRKKRLI
jgi:hypothetical protein